MKDFLDRFEKLANEYPDVALAVAIIFVLALLPILNLYGRALKEQIESLTQQNTILEGAKVDLDNKLSKLSEYENSFEMKMEQLRQAQLKLATYSDFENELDKIQQDINQRIASISATEHDSEVLRGLQQTKARIQETSYRHRKFREGLSETVQAATILRENKDAWVDTAVDQFLLAKKNRKRKRNWWSKILAGATRRK